MLSAEGGTSYAPFTTMATRVLDCFADAAVLLRRQLFPTNTAIPPSTAATPTASTVMKVALFCFPVPADCSADALKVF